MEKKPVGFLVVLLDKRPNGILISLCDRQVAGPSSLPVAVVQ